jgi:hypothetical protein
MSKGKKKPSLRDLTRQKPTSEELKVIMLHIVGFAQAREIPPGTDRLIAISMGAYLERILEEGLIASFQNSDAVTVDALFSDHGLATFQAKIIAAYALGTIDAATRDDLQHIRRIRNVFAHSTATITFDTEIMAAECRKLKFARFVRLPPITDGTVEDVYKAKEVTPRLHFIGHTSLLAWSLTHRYATEALERVKNQLKAKGDESALAKVGEVGDILHGLGVAEFFDKMVAQAKAASKGSS